MGNCCGKSEHEAAFQGEGRTLNATPATIPSASKNGRSAAAFKVGGPGRTLGSTSAGQPATPGEAAARAAEQRLNSPKGGKLQQQLNAQKSQTHNETLAQTARENLAARNADANAEARNHN